MGVLVITIDAARFRCSNLETNQTGRAVRQNTLVRALVFFG